MCKKVEKLNRTLTIFLTHRYIELDVDYSMLTEFCQRHTLCAYVSMC